MIQATGHIGTQWILALCNGIVKEGCIPEDWKSTVVLPISKGKGVPTECGSYRGIKSLEHSMKVVERILIEIDDMQFGYMRCEGITDAVLIIRQMRDNFRVKGKKLCFGFLDLEKPFDRVLREVIRWVMRKLGIEEWLVLAVMSMYTCAKTVVRTAYGNSKCTEVKVGVQQCSSLIP